MSLKDYYQSELWEPMFIIINPVPHTPFEDKFCAASLTLPKVEPAGEEVV